MFNPSQSLLLVVDIQQRLADKMTDAKTLISNSQHLTKAAQLMNIPVLATEQAPEKIGGTVTALKDFLRNTTIIPKKSFSCCGEPNFNSALKKSKRQQIVLIGIETHVCVLQTAVALIEQSYQVQIVVDATFSRKETDKKIALDRLEQAGGFLTTTEMIITEWLQGAEHPNFKEIMSLIK